MIKLMRSTDCGYSYHEYASAETIDDLQSQMDKLNTDGFRWYLEDASGNQLLDYPCAIHKAILAIFGVESDDTPQPTESHGK